MSYRTRRKKEVQAREEKTEHLMSEPAPLVLLGPKDIRPEWVPLRFDARTVREVRVSTLLADLPGYASRLDMSVEALEALIAARRYLPGPAPKAVEPRQPSWYLSDWYR